jgi:hypothetical protein
MRSARRFAWLGALIVMMAGARAAEAQAFSRLEPGEQVVTVETGLQSAVVTSVGYAAGLRIAAIDRTVMPFVQATLVMARPDLHDYAFRGGAQVSLVRTGGFDLSTQLAFQVAGTDNSIYSGTALGSNLVLLAGHYAKRWFAVAEAGYDRAWLTYIKNSDWYHDYFFSGAQDGWYSGTGGTLHAGIKGGATFGRVEIVARAGLVKTEDLQSLDLPFYGTLGANCRF